MRSTARPLVGSIPSSCAAPSPSASSKCVKCLDNRTDQNYKLVKSMERAKKECILEAAARAFSRAGFKKASVDEIAKDAGVAKGTVYLASDSKEHLFFQSVHREVREVVGELSKIIDPTLPADQLLQEVARQAVAIVSQRPLVRGLFACDFHA